MACVEVIKSHLPLNQYCVQCQKRVGGNSLLSYSHTTSVCYILSSHNDICMLLMFANLLPATYTHEILCKAVLRLCEMNKNSVSLVTRCFSTLHLKVTIQKLSSGLCILTNHSCISLNLLWQAELT